MKAHLRAQAAPWRHAVELCILSADGKTHVKEIILEESREVIEPDPSFMLSLDHAQLLMDDLWHAGLRPTEGAGSAGAMRAVERHLEDMRKIAFDQLTQKQTPPHP
jgi:hypothetical protein